MCNRTQRYDDYNGFDTKAVFFMLPGKRNGFVRIQIFSVFLYVSAAFDLLFALYMYTMRDSI